VFFDLEPEPALELPQSFCPLCLPHEIFANHRLSGKGHFKNGIRHGKLMAIGDYVAGELGGRWERWRENGQPLQAGAFKMGNKLALGALLRKRSTLGRGCLQRRQESREMENLRQVSRTQAVQDIQSEKMSATRQGGKSIKFYVWPFKNSKVGKIERYAAGEAEPEGTVKVQGSLSTDRSSWQWIAAETIVLLSRPRFRSS
jgi:hypothetical protein